MLVVCNGMIRSGSTIQYNLARTLVERADRGEGIGFVDHEQTVDTALLDELSAGPTFKVAKTHRHLPEIEPYCRNGTAIVCFTYRHLLDVAGSAKTKFGWPWEQIEAGIEEGIEVHRWSESIPGAVIQRYEDLMADLPAATRQLHDRLGLGLDDPEIADAAHANAVNTVMQKLNTMQGAARRRDRVKGVLRNLGLLGLASRINRTLPEPMRYRPVIDTQTNLHHNHISRGGGQPGVSRQALSADETHRVIDRFGEYLHRFGYDDAAPEQPDTSSALHTSPTREPSA